MKHIRIIFFIFFLLFSSNLVNINGRSILKEGITIIPSRGGKLIAFEENNKIGFVLNRSDYVVMIEPKFDNFYNENFYLSNEMILVSIDGKWGAVNSSLDKLLKYEPSIPCIYDKMTPFRNGKSKVTKDGKIFYIDINGNIIK